ncbi:elongation factor Ts, mitochondrial [Diachasma alloeum]|uniref:elongation factor Ts, mitochondrial n=1 Tax=Diachasma alloeum TaxID=454923 RepID=UPI00073836D7|nr:elongation factor Ts, mitochondrial [Diachasma alloeum]XP_015126016.1 elongation factor Ts, mitochondrial [Diachasma alloeum]
MLSSQLCRYFYSGNTLWQSSTKLLLAKLRKKTGYTFSNCKKALELHENDYAKAEAWLREQAQAMGWSKAQKLQGRSTKQGLVAVMVDKNHGALVEINCETDFVARNKTFHGLAEIIVSAVLKFTGEQQAVDQVHRTLLDAEALKNLPAVDGKTVADHAALTIGTIGENIAVKRALCMSVDPSIQLVGCTHPASVNPIPASFGRYGALLAFKSPSENKTLGMQLCQHIIGMNPTKIGQPGVDEPISNADDETTMIHQEFLLDPSLTVQQLLLGAHIEIVDFARFEMGEDPEPSEETVDTAEPMKSCG